MSLLFENITCGGGWLCKNGAESLVLFLEIMPIVLWILIFIFCFTIFQTFGLIRQNIRLKKTLREYEDLGDLLFELGEINLSRAKDLRKLTDLIEVLPKHKR